jgi:hypothetical protein
VARKPPPKTIRSTAPTRPMLWRLADASGQVWEHADPDWLRCWVTYRNGRVAVSRVAPQSDPVATPPGGACTSGRCRPAR